MAGLLTDSYTFETFRQTEGNRFAYAASMAVTSNPNGTAYNPLVIYGKSWTGKTHLLYAIKHKIETNYPEKKISLVSMMDFIPSLAAGITDETEGRTNCNLQYDVLLIDDFSFIRGKPSTQEFMGKLAKTFVEHGKQMVISHTGDIKELPEFENYVRNSISTALFCDIVS